MSLIASSHNHQTGANVPQSLFTTVQERFGEIQYTPLSNVVNF
jgi:hypothetical protein